MHVIFDGFIINMIAHDYNNGKTVIHESHLKVCCLKNGFPYVSLYILASVKTLAHAHRYTVEGILSSAGE